MLSIWLLYAVSGMFTGFLAGLLGVGGGAVTVPLLVYIFGREHFPPQHIFLIAVATSFANILFTSASSVLAHHQRGSVNWWIVRRMAPGIVIGTLAGTLFAAHAPTVLLEGVFVAFLGFVSTQMLLGRKQETSGVLPGKAVLTGASMAIGGLASLVGVGGAALTVPFITRGGVKFHTAIGTAAAVGCPIALAGMAGYVVNGLFATDLPPYSVGYVYLPALIGLTVAGMLAAPWGAKLAHRLPVDKLRKIFALMLFSIAIKLALNLFA